MAAADGMRGDGQGGRVASDMAEKGIGARVVRKEDQRFITGKGRYTDDISQHGQAHAYFVRIPHAHARIRGIDKASAEAMPGVLAVLTGEDVKADGLGNLICGWLVKSKDGSPMKMGPHPLLAQGKARYVGDPVAVVVAETYRRPRTRPRRSRSTTSRCRPSSSVEKAHDPGVAVHDEVPNNLIYDWEIGDKAAIDAAFARAAHVTRIDLTNNRLVPNPMEPRAAVGHYDAGTESSRSTSRAEPARPPAGDLGLHRRGARAQAPRGGARRGRRLRLEDLHLRRGVRRPLGVEEGRRPAGEVDRGAQRGLPLRRAWPRPCHPRRARDGRGGQRSWRCG